jgi:arylsulfatase A-like enzyme
MDNTEVSTRDSQVMTRPERHPARQLDRDEREVSESPTSEPSFGPLAAIEMSIWFGLLTGLAELGLKLALKPLYDPSPGFFRMNRHIVWTIPTVNLVVFGVCGLLLALVARVWPRRAARIAAGLLSGMAVLTLLLTYQRLFVWSCVIVSCGLAYRLSRRIKVNLAAFRRFERRSLPLLAGGVLALVSFSLGWHVIREHWAMSMRLPITSNGPNAPNVLLIVLDTVRADHLSLHGYGRDTTPNLARLARRGVRFEQARSTAPWTLPSHSSMMTGRWPHQLSAGLHGPLDSTCPTLAQWLAGNGYATAGFVSNTTYTGAETGLARGFSHYEDHDLSPRSILCTTALGQRFFWQGLLQVKKFLGCDLFDLNELYFAYRKDASRINHDLLAWIDRQDKQPFFAFLNYADAHNPYVTPPSFKRHFGVKPESLPDFATLERWFVFDKKKLSSRDTQLAFDGYDDCIAYLDEQLGHLFDELDRRGQLENTLVIVTADHGEHFGEHKLYGHASSLYDPEIHVPLLAVLPRGAHAGKSIAAPVSLRDIPATVNDLLGLGRVSPFPGQSLARFWGSSERSKAEPLLSEVDVPVKAAPNQGRSPVFRGPMKALAYDQEVYIRNGDGIEEVYDLVTDPLQTRNLVGSPSVLPKLEAFRADLERMTRDDTRPPEWRGIVAKRPLSKKAVAPEKGRVSEKPDRSQPNSPAAEE